MEDVWPVEKFEQDDEQQVVQDDEQQVVQPVQLQTPEEIEAIEDEWQQWKEDYEEALAMDDSPEFIARYGDII